MNKIFHPTYLSNNKEYLLVTAADTEGGNGPPLDSNYLSEKLQLPIKYIKLWCGNNKILDNFTLQVFLPSHQVCQ